MEKKILVIDDSFDFINYVGNNLRADGYKVITATNPALGIEKAIMEIPNIIILDVSMPGMDGFTVLEALKNNSETANIPIIIFTAMGELEHLKQIAEQAGGVVEFLDKSIPFDNLIEIIKKY